MRSKNPPEDVQKHIEYIKENGSDEFETKHLCKDGNILDVHITITLVNDSYCRKFDKTSEELIGTSFTPLVHEDDIEPTMQDMRDLDRPPYREHDRQVR